MELKPRDKGLTLAELLVAFALLSLIFIITTTAYVSALRLLQNLQTNAGAGTASSETGTLIAMEHIAKRARLANLVSVTQITTPTVQYQLKMRMDYNPTSLAPLVSPYGSTLDTTNDQWVKYALIQDGGTGPWKLRWKVAAAQDGGVISTDSEVTPDLILTAASTFSQVSTTSPGTIAINLAATVGAPAHTFTLSSNLAPGLATSTN